MNREQRHGYPTLNSFAKARIASFNNTERTFGALFELMFVETGRIFYERSEGEHIIKTTFGEAREETLRRATSLKQDLINLPDDTVVGLYMENSLSWIEMFWAIILCGWRPLLMNLRLDSDTLEQALSDSKAGAVIAQDRSPVFSVRTIKESSLIPAGEMLSIGKTGGEILVMSSGSTGSLKLCAYGPDEFFSQVSASIDMIRILPQAKKHYNGYLKQLCFLPFYHIFGLVAVYVWFAFFSCCFVELGDLSPDTIQTVIRRHGVTHIFAVPLFWEKVYDRAVSGIKDRGDAVWAKFQKGMRIASLTGDIPVIGRLFSRLAFREVRAQMFGESPRLFISGGSEISDEVVTFFNNIGYHMANGYGMSEVGITSVELSRKRSVRTSGSAGAPIPRIDYSLSDDGELLIRSSGAAKYIIEGGKTRQRDEWFSTGDLAECDRGHYKILGRKDDIVVTASGENINPVIVESSFNLPGIKRAALISTKSGQKTEPVFIISIAEDASNIRTKVYERLSEIKLSGEIRHVLFTPDDLMGPDDFKLNRRLIKERYAAGKYRDFFESENSGADKTFSDGELYVMIRSRFAEALAADADAIYDDFDFFVDGGGTSLDYLAMVAELEDDLGFESPQDVERSPVTVREFVEFIDKTAGHIA